MKTLRLILFFVLVLTGTGCGSGESGPEEEAPQTIQLTSPAFEAGGTIPQAYTCDGEDISPPLSWTGVPEGTRSLALVMDDPDAPGGTFTHWVLYDIPADASELPEDVPPVFTVEGAGTQGNNSFGNTGYDGPCPPAGQTHDYILKLYALDAALELPAQAEKTEVESAMQGHILAQGELTGRYGR